MKRILSGVAVAMLVGLPAAHAGGGGYGGGGGGFCQGGRATEGEGTTVNMAKACFTPTVLRTDPGSTVDFINDDTVPHTVTAAGGTWGDGHAEIAPGETMSIEFDAAGVYAYSCLYHPGMTGTVVVGDSSALGAGATVVSVGPPSQPKPEVQIREVEVPAQGNAAAATGVAAGSALAAGALGFVIGRRRSGLGAVPREARI